MALDHYQLILGFQHPSVGKFLQISIHLDCLAFRHLMLVRGLRLSNTNQTNTAFHQPNPTEECTDMLPHRDQNLDHYALQLGRDNHEPIVLLRF